MRSPFIACAGFLMACFCLSPTHRAQGHPSLVDVHRLHFAQPYGEMQMGAGPARKVDQVGAYDIVRVDVQLPVTGDEFIDTFSVEISCVAQEPIDDVIIFYSPFFRAQRIQVSPPGASTESLDWRLEEDTGELVIPLSSRIPEGTEFSIRFEGRADLESQCAVPQLCVRDQSLMHLAFPGWFPLSAAYPAGDRFELSVVLNSMDGLTALSTGRRENLGASNQEGPWRHRTEVNTYLTVVAAGQYQAEVLEGIEYYGPFGQGPGVIHEALISARMVYEELLGPYPFSSLRVVAIDESAAVGIGAQATLLLPESLWGVPADDPYAEIVAQVASHELGHQYFFNLIGIIDTGEGWMSEGFAEYLAVRASERRRGDTGHEERNYWGYLNRVPADADRPVQGDAVRSSQFGYEILYLKGSAFLSILERSIGRDRFDQIMAEYVAQFAYANTTTEEFLSFLADREESVDIENLFRAWIFTPGHLVLRVRAHRPRPDRPRYELKLEVDDLHRDARPALNAPIYQSGDGPRAPLSLAMETGTYPVALEGASTSLSIDPFRTLFRRVRVDPSGDVDLNGVVDGMDFLDVLAAQGRSIEEAQWRDEVDLSDDGVVDAVDLDMLRRSMGQGWRGALP